MKQVKKKENRQTNSDPARQKQKKRNIRMKSKEQSKTKDGKKKK